MVTFYSNSTTAKLEGFARVRGRNLGIVISPGNMGGRYFVTYDRDANELCHPWWSLGWTVEDAKEKLLDLIAEDERRDQDRADMEDARSY